MIGLREVSRVTDEPSTETFSQRIANARDASGPGAFGEIAQTYREWLHLLARIALDRSLQIKTDADDLVQETLLQACRDRARFRGESVHELAAWLRGILAHVIAHEVRRYKSSKKRNLQLEARIDQNLAHSSMNIAANLVADDTSPSGRAMREEESLLLAQALARLPGDYREVVILRSVLGLPHPEVARRLGRSEGAVRMLWLRALSRLKEEASRWTR